MRVPAAKILRSPSKLPQPATALDRTLHCAVLLLWCAVAATWATARSRLVEARIAHKLSDVNGRRQSVLLEIDWWKTGRARLRRSSGLDFHFIRGRGGGGQGQAPEKGQGQGRGADEDGQLGAQSSGTVGRGAELALEGPPAGSAGQAQQNSVEDAEVHERRLRGGH